MITGVKTTITDEHVNDGAELRVNGGCIEILMSRGRLLENPEGALEYVGDMLNALHQFGARAHVQSRAS